MKTHPAFNAHAIILAGGKSSRMGTNKATLTVDKETLVERHVRKLSPLFQGIIVSTPHPLACVGNDILNVPDRQTGFGPLMAIYSSLSASPSQVNFIVACDIPELHIPLIGHLMSFSDEYEIIAPAFKEGYPEPLFAVYNRSILPVIEKQLAADKLKITRTYPLCRTRIVPIENQEWYHNLNTPEDYRHYLHNRKGVQS